MAPCCPPPPAPEEHVAPAPAVGGNGAGGGSGCPLGFGGGGQASGCPLGFSPTPAPVYRNRRGHRVPPPRSWLDRVQRDAQASELEPGNTSPGAFVGMALGQCLVLWACSPSARFQLVAALAIGSHWLGFCLSIALRTDKFFDICEDVSYMCALPGPARRTDWLLVFGGAMLWCARLCLHVGIRVMVRGGDWRFDKLISEPAYNWFGWTSGGTWCWANGFCLWALADSPDQPGLDGLDRLGLGLFALGLVIETVADLQKYRHTYGSNPQFIRSGLWSVSRWPRPVAGVSLRRHPNYAGEVMVWAGLALASVGGWGRLRLANWDQLLLRAVSPVWSLVFLMFTSLMLLEKRADAKWGGDMKYEAYKLNTPLIFPGFS